MNQQAESSTATPIILTLEVIPSDLNDADPALVEAVGRDATSSLLQEGARVEPVYTGQRGGLLVVVTMAATFLWSNKEVIIADVSGLITIITSGVLPLVNKLQAAYKRRVGNDTAAQYPLAFTLDIAGKPVRFEAANIESAEEVLKLAQRIEAEHPGMSAKGPPVKLTTRVPKSPARKRR